MSVREKVLDAAIGIVREQGVAKLTLDEAARQAGVSKGGVLYHFPSKDALIEGMVARLVGQCENLQHCHFQSLPEGPNRWARAVIMAAFDAAGPANDPVGGALLAAVATNPALIEPLREVYVRSLARMKEEGGDSLLSTLACLALDGLWLQEMIGLKLFSQADREDLKNRLISLLSTESRS
jgi:AcrR family transcriptional regulator